MEPPDCIILLRYDMISLLEKPEYNKIINVIQYTQNGRNKIAAYGCTHSQCKTVLLMSIMRLRLTTGIIDL